MTEDRTPVDQALDLLVYAPLGLALSARDLIPKLAERGREQWTSQVGMARLIGQFAVKQGTAEAEKALTRAREQALAKLTDLGLLKDADDAERQPGTADGAGANGATAPAPSEPTPRPTTTAPPAGRPAATAERAAPPPSPAPIAAAPTPSAEPAPTAAALAIHDYDSLSASQVVPRLSGLVAAELEVVRTYEAAHRGRKTILNKITQLEAR